jgi:multicomponent Na+:H+ antiporter subunit F
MNEWLLGASVLTVALIPCLWVAVRSSFADGLVAVQLAGTLASLALLMLAEGETRQPFSDLALVLAVVSFAGSLLFARFLERSR